MNTRPPTTDHRSLDYYTLADLLTHWERGEMTLEEVIARWPRDGATNDELLKELLRTLIGLLGRIRVLEDKARFVQPLQ